MTPIQRLIKLIANAIAIGLVVAIIGGAATALLAISGVRTLKNDIEENKADFKDLKEYTVTSTDINSLDIEVGAADISIKKGEKFTVEYSGINFDFSEKKGKLEIESDNNSVFGLNSAGKLIITIPKKKSFSKVSLNAGAGDIYIEALNCSALDLDLGAGKVDIDYLKVKSNASVDGGAGELNIASGNINNLDISLGVGQTNISAALIGKNNIDAGVGELNLTLSGTKNNYTVSTDTGIGDFKVDGKRVTDDELIGEGENFVDIDGGVGSIKVEFAK